MKNFIILTVTLLSLKVALAQPFSTACDTSGNYIPFSTNFEDPSYNLNQMPLANPLQYINGLDWNSISGFELEDMYFAGIHLDYMTALTSTQTSADDFYHYIYDGASAITKRHLHSEGWELLSVNLGRYPDAETQDQTVKFRSMPFIVLYNRYQGIVRVFVSMGSDKTINEAADAISVNLRIKNATTTDKLNGILRLYDGYDLALDQPTIVKTASTLSKAVNAQGDWASCDFQVAFDPCVCNYPSAMFLEFDHVKSQQLELYGRSVELGNIDIMSDQMSLTPTGFLSGFNLKVAEDLKSGTAGAGLVIENSINSIIDEYISRYEKYQAELKIANKHNEKVKLNLAILKFTKAAIIFVATHGANISDVVTWNALEQQGLAFSLQYIANGQATTFDDGNWFKTVTKALSSISKKVNDQSKKIDEKELFKYLKMILGEEGKQFITKNFELVADPTTPVKPSNTIAYSEMRFTGSITTKAKWNGPLFATPGAFGTSIAQTSCAGDDIFYYPNYNTPLGVFSLLETPKIIKSKTVVDEDTKGGYEWISRIGIVNGSVFPPVYGTIWDIKVKRYQNWTNNYQYKLASPLKFSFNNALDIKDYKIQAFLRVNNTLVANPDNWVVYSSAFIDPDYTTNMSSLELDVDQYDKIYQKGLTGNDLSFEDGSNHFQAEYLPTSTPIVSKTKTNFELNTMYHDVNTIMNSVSSVGVKNEIVKENTVVLDASQPKPVLQNGQWIFPDFNQLNIGYPSVVNPNTTGVTLSDNVELVLLVDVVFNSLNELGLNNSTTMVLTYKVPINEQGDVQNTDIYPNLENSVLNISQYKENLNFSNTVFDGQEVEGCKINGNVYTCQAWNNITIEGDLTTSNGFSAKLIAGNEIEQQFESNISPEITLEIIPVLDYSSPMPPVTPGYLQGFCAGTNPNAPSYQAKSGSKSIQDSNQVVIETTTITEPKQPFSFSLFPNPTTQQTTVKVNGEYADQVSIVVYDIAGKEQRVAISGEGGRFNLDVSHLAKGLYLVKVSTFGESQTKQLVIN